MAMFATIALGSVLFVMVVLFTLYAERDKAALDGAGS
jgi:hypothetical protein